MSKGKKSLKKKSLKKQVKHILKKKDNGKIKKSKKSLKKHKVKNECAPFVNDNALDDICYTEEGIIKIAKAWNKDNPNDKIKIPSTKRKLSKQIRRKLWNDIQLKLKGPCNDDICVRKESFVKNNISEHDPDIDVFKPEMPKKWDKNPREWLNTLDINHVLTQYEKAYPEFIYFGAVPIDFDKKLTFGECVVNELCKINLGDLVKRGKTKIGIVFNIDPHDKPGQHWIAMYCDISGKNGNIYFWDSYGIDPPKEVMELAQKLEKQGENLDKKMKTHINSHRHQYKNTECGIYSINFIVQLLRGKSFNNVTKKIIRDDEMFSKRENYFIRNFKKDYVNSLNN